MDLNGSIKSSAKLYELSSLQWFTPNTVLNAYATKVLAIALLTIVYPQFKAEFIQLSLSLLKPSPNKDLK